MSHAKILVVEDDPDLRRDLVAWLRARGYGVLATEDGITAVSTAIFERPDLILLDIGVPGREGLARLERYSNLPQPIPVLVLTGDTAAAHRATLTEHGVLPVEEAADSEAALSEAVEEALRRPLLPSPR